MEFPSSSNEFDSGPRHPELEDDDERSERWLLSYADLITTLMVFFLALYILQVAKTKESEIKAASARVVVADPRPAAPQPPAAKARLIAQLAPLVERRQITINETPQGVEIAINAKILFNPAEARLLPDALNDLARVADILKSGSPKSILVEGHTDSLPISTAKYASNWELSAARAGAVVRFLVERGIEPRRLAAIGRADNDPLMLGDDAAARAANRRVTLLAQY